MAGNNTFESGSGPGSADSGFSSGPSAASRRMAGLLALLTLGTAATVLWIVAEAMRSEQFAARQRWNETAHIRLTDARQRLLDGFFSTRRVALLQLADQPPSQVFAAAVRDGIADSLICQAASGPEIYPQPFTLDGDGRRSAPARDLHALQQAHQAGQELPPAVAGQLERELGDYTAPSMPAPQRRFLMLALAQLKSQSPAALFDTFPAETLAAQYHLRKTAAVSLQLAEKGPLLLFEENSLTAKLKAAADAPGLGILTAAQTPEAGAALVEIHPALPGWRLSMTRGAQDQSTRRIVFYGWTGGAFVLLLGGLTALTWRHVRNQLRRARLQHDLAATVSHELRTPVAAMRLLVESLQEDASLDEAKTRDYLALMAAENHRLSQLIDHFLTLARLDKARPGATTRLSVRELMERTASTAKAAGHGERLRLQFPADGAFLEADVSLLEIALFNLIDNACKFSPPGSDVLFKASAGRAGNLIRFSVTDQGPGLTAAEQNRLWQPFERLARHRATHRGCGLGLAIVRRVATQAGGAVEIASTPGQGSTFSLLLPATPPP